MVDFQAMDAHPTNRIHGLESIYNPYPCISEGIPYVLVGGIPTHLKNMS